MAFLTALFKAVLEWLSAEVQKDTKASDATAVSKETKITWAERIREQEAKMAEQKKENENSNSS